MEQAGNITGYLCDFVSLLMSYMFVTLLHWYALVLWLLLSFMQWHIRQHQHLQGCCTSYHIQSYITRMACRPLGHLFLPPPGDPLLLVWVLLPALPAPGV